MSSRWTGAGFGLLAALIWGGFPVVTRLGVAHSTLDSYDVTFIRFAVSGTVLLPVLLHRGFGGLKALPIVLLIVGIGAPYILAVAAGLSLAAVGFFALTPGSMIALTAILSRIVMKERLSPMQITGIATVLLGMALAGSNALSGSGGWAAVALFLLGGLLWAIYNITARRWAIDALLATAIVSVGSAVIYCPIYLATRGLGLLHAPLGAIVLQAVYQGVMVSILGLYFFSRAVTILGPAVGATFAALVPVLATIEAALLLGEQPHPLALLGILIVTIGMAISLFKPYQSALQSTPASSQLGQPVPQAEQP
ncbi:DMT family transporter [Bradyrhizobium sp. 2TAF24]|uniref:DMT family transporter n=1 Tax=Bradyrhizobium sp. 2TAF24 TaxID=3233011 RepID=UPI003F92025C